MKNKLPKIGTVYRHTSGLTSRLANHSRITSISEDQLSWWMEFSFENGMTHTCQLERFLEDYEELPEDKAETKPETQSHISELSPEVKEAMDKIRKAKKFAQDELFKMEDSEVSWARSKAYEREVWFWTDRLLNALDKQFKASEATKETVNLKKEDEVQVSYKVLKTGEFEGRPPLDQLIREDKVKISDVERAKEELDRELDCWMPTEDREEYILVSKAQALIDALDAEKK